VNSWAEISAERLATNYRILKQTADEQVDVLAVIKADAYGHGAALCAPVLVQAGAKWLGVTDASEGAAVRDALASAGIPAGRQPRILVMSEPLPEDAEAIVRHRLTPVVSSIPQMQALGRYSPAPLSVHIEIDTGMSRQGVAPGPALAAVLEFLEAHLGVIHLEGVMTHFASAEIAGSHQSADQRGRFNEALLQIASAGHRPEWIHAGNSSAIDNQCDSIPWLRWVSELARTHRSRAMVRTGLGLYGYALPMEAEQGYNGSTEPHIRRSLHPVLTWKARITGMREIQPGTRIGYNGTFTAQQPMSLALLPVGYADGLRRELSSTNERSGGWVMIGGRRAAIVGRVSMNLTVVDVTEIAAVAVGDEVVVLGDGVTADDHAACAATIPYEILCGVRALRRLTN
jgi:alanine racemase